MRYKKSAGRMMSRGRPGILALALVMLLLAAACGKSADNANGGNTNGGNSSSAPASNVTASTPPAPPAGMMTPSAVFKAYYDAAGKRDFATAKKYLSRGTINQMEDDARKQGKTAEEVMKEMPAAKPDNMPQISNEQVSGDAATVDLTSQGRTVKLPFVKEGGEWKVALDKFFEDMKKEAESASPTAGPGGNKVDNSNNH